MGTTKADCTGETKRIHKHNRQKNPIQASNNEAEAVFARRQRVTRRHWRPPNGRLVVLNSGHHRAWLEKVETLPSGTAQGAKLLCSLAHDGHSPRSDVRHDQHYMSRYPKLPFTTMLMCAFDTLVGPILDNPKLETLASHFSSKRIFIVFTSR